MVDEEKKMEDDALPSVITPKMDGTNEVVSVLTTPMTGPSVPSSSGGNLSVNTAKLLWDSMVPNGLSGGTPTADGEIDERTEWQNHSEMACAPVVKLKMLSCGVGDDQTMSNPALDTGLGNLCAVPTTDSDIDPCTYVKSTTQEGIERMLTLRSSSQDRDSIFNIRSHDQQDSTNNNDNNNDNDEPRSVNDVWEPSRKTRLQRWSELTGLLRDPLLRLMVGTARLSARYPWYVVGTIFTMSLSVVLTGLFTNFYVETDDRIMWAPPGSTTSQNHRWVAEESGFVDLSPSMVAIISAQGDNVLTVDAMMAAFEAFDAVRNLDSYQALCGGENPKLVCQPKSPTGFWDDHNVTLFQDDVATDEAVRLKLSSFLYSNGVFVDRDVVFGKNEPKMNVNQFRAFLISSTNRQQNSTMTDVLNLLAKKYELETAKSYLLDWGIPIGHKDPELTKEALAVSAEGVEVIMALNDKWQRESRNKLSVYVSTQASRSKEIVRGILDDIPTLSLAFFTMMGFCLYSLGRYHRIKSHSLLGIGAVATILVAICTGYGMMFCAGIPLTTLTYLFPYGMMGLGLDSAFILTGQFAYTNPNLDIVDRIVHTMEEVGLSIAVSTLTTCAAYLLGSFSNMLGLTWFCWYASLTVLVNGFYMTSFFVALIVLDDRRIKANRLDVLVCLKSTKYVGTGNDPDHGKTHERIMREEQERMEKMMGNRIMDAYSRLLMVPAVKACVLVLFAALAAGGSYIAKDIGRSLGYQDIYPPGSYVLDMFSNIEEYSDIRDFFVSAVYFRDVDVSDPDVQDQMLDFVFDMEDLSYIKYPPLTFWLRDYKFWMISNKTMAAMDDDFDSTINLFLDMEPYKSLYDRDIVRNENGTIVASRTLMVFDQIEGGNVDMEVDAFIAQYAVSDGQPINADSKDRLKFFSHGSSFYWFWELWSILFGEMLYTVILGLCALFVICLVFVSHPLAAFILAPTVFAVYVEIIAVLRIAGLSINVLSAIGLICCLGLVMDYSTHVCITYFEIQTAKDRNERVRKVITVMGKSILKGGFTTFLGVVFLSWKQMLAFRTIFITFVGITTLGVGHGLIFIPVVLSLLGPMDDIRSHGIDGKDAEKRRSETSVEEIPDLPGIDSGLNSNYSGFSTDLNARPVDGMEQIQLTDRS